MPGPQPSATRIMSPEAAWAWSSGASGMACDADIPSRPSPMANAEAARIFIDLPFFLQTSREATELQQECYGLVSPTAPVAVVPVAVAPAPMATTPAPVTVAPMAVVPVMPPPHFFGCDPIDLVARGHGGMDIFIAGRQPALTGQLRRKRRGLRARDESGGARSDDGRTQTKVEKKPRLPQ